MGKLTECTPVRHLQAKGHVRANVRVIVLVLVVFLLGCAITVLWLYQGGKSGSGIDHSNDKSASTRALSEGTLKVLNRVTSPVEIRFYSLLDPSSTPDSLKTFSTRVDQLIASGSRATPEPLVLTHQRRLRMESSPLTWKKVTPVISGSP
jgi:hypothetical protein